jgi:hypothetical protein
MSNYKHLLNMTDKRGILQFSNLDKPDPQSGYTLDDNARALIVALYMDDGHNLAHIYSHNLLNFLQPDGSWSNLLLNGIYFSEFNSQDSVGRALLACSLGSNCSWPDIRELCISMYIKNISQTLDFVFPRAIAYALISLCHFRSYDLPEKSDGLIGMLSQRLISFFNNHHSKKWLWFEDEMTYCNGILPHALLAAYLANQDKEILKVGLDTLDFLNGILFRKGYLNIIGNKGWYNKKGAPPLFDQQPVDAASIIFANHLASQASGKKEYLEQAQIAHAWYRGLNVHKLSMIDEKGGCYDGLTAEGLNLNRGSEALLSLLLSDMLMNGLMKNAFVPMEKSDISAVV